MILETRYVHCCAANVVARDAQVDAITVSIDYDCYIALLNRKWRAEVMTLFYYRLRNALRLALQQQTSIAERT